MLVGSVWSAVGDETRVTLLHLYGEVVARLPAALLAVVIIVLASFLSRFAYRSATAVASRVLSSASLHILFAKAASLTVWIIAVLVASLLLFPGLRLGDIVATLGLGSVAIGFAFQDIFKNFLAGVLLLVNEPFRIGDVICVETYEGVVEHISIRTTNVRTYTGERVLIPNSVVFTTSVRVRTAFAKRRTDLVVGVAYDAPLEHALELARTTIAGVEGVADDPPIFVDASAFGESTIDVTVRYWTDSDPKAVLRTRTRAVLALKAAYDAAGIEIPFPTRTLYVRGNGALPLGQDSEADARSIP